MIQPLLSLSRPEAITCAALLLDSGLLRMSVTSNTGPTPSIQSALNAARFLPISWRNEWALSVLRGASEAPEVRLLIAAARRARIEIPMAVWICCPLIYGAEFGAESLEVRLVSKTGELKTRLFKDKIMTQIADTAPIASLPLQLHIGELALGIDELLALQRGEQIQCSLPDSIPATVHVHGAAIGQAKILFFEGKISVVIEQLFALVPDNSVTSL